MSRATVPDWLAPHRGVNTDQPQTFESTSPEGVTVSGDFSAVERLGCATHRLSVKPSQPLPCDVSDLRRRAESLTAAVPGGMAIQEADQSAPSVLLRSPPRHENETVEYEQAVLSPSGVTFERMAYTPSEGRQPVEFPMTWEQYETLVEAGTAAVAPEAPGS